MTDYPTEDQVKKAMLLGYNLNYPNKWDLKIINDLISIEESKGKEKMIMEFNKLKGF